MSTGVNRLLSFCVTSTFVLEWEHLEAESRRKVAPCCERIETLYANCYSLFQNFPNSAKLSADTLQLNFTISRSLRLNAPFKLELCHCEDGTKLSHRIRSEPQGEEWDCKLNEVMFCFAKIYNAKRYDSKAKNRDSDDASGGPSRALVGNSTFFLLNYRHEWHCSRVKFFSIL